MATVQVRNLDDAAYAVLKQRAAVSGRSLQEYLRVLLEQQAAEPTVAEALARVRVDIAWTDGEVAPTMADIVAIQRAGRAR
jgi:plasmid stability protein